MIELQDRLAAGPTIRLHDGDNIVIARTDVGIGTPLPAEGISSRSQVAAGHKIARTRIAKGDPIRKYGVTIGFAAAEVVASLLLGALLADVAVW